MRLVFLFLIGILGSTAEAAAFGYLAFGDVRGHLEPCGCDPATDLGGMRRIATVIQRERLQDPGLAVFCTGNVVAPPREGKLKTPFILEATAKAPVDACLLGELEWQSLGDLAQTKVPFVLSNLAPAAKAVPAHPFVEGPSFIALGYLAPERGDSKALRPLNKALLSTWKKLLAKHENRAKILLFSGNDKDLAAVEAAQLFDFVVSANEAPLDAIVGTAEHEDETKLDRKRSRLGTMMVPLGAQGVLRGGSARGSEAKSIGELFATPTPAPGALGAPGAGSGAKLPFAEAKLVTWLDRGYESEASLKDLYVRYAAATKSAFDGAAAERLKDLAQTPYAGAEACVACHAAASASWKASKHAVAMQTLKAKEKHEDPECVACHAVGAKEKGGFVSLTASPHLADVQCEVCHGPRKDHVANPTIKPKLAVAARDACASCHNAQHSPAFVKDAYWKQIAHGK